MTKKKKTTSFYNLASSPPSNKVQDLRFRKIDTKDVAPLDTIAIGICYRISQSTTEIGSDFYRCAGTAVSIVFAVIEAIL
jgi:hypothetical protein